MRRVHTLNSKKFWKIFSHRRKKIETTDHEPQYLKCAFWGTLEYEFRLGKFYKTAKLQCKLLTNNLNILRIFSSYQVKDLKVD